METALSVFGGYPGPSWAGDSSLAFGGDIGGALTCLSNLQVIPAWEKLQGLLQDKAGIRKDLGKSEKWSQKGCGAIQQGKWNARVSSVMQCEMGYKGADKGLGVS